MIRRVLVAVLLCALGLLSPSAFADVPRMVHYQGKLRETSGALVNGTVSLEFKLYGHPTDPGPVLFTEAHGTVSVSNGLFNVLIGSQAGGVPDSALDAAEVYLGISVNGGTELSPRPQLVSNPHAIKSRSSEQLVKPGTFETAASVDGSGQVGVGTTTPAALLDVSGDGASVLVPRKSDTGDPTGVDGMIYYNTADGKFRGHENGSWGDLRDGSGSASDPCNCPTNPWEMLGAINTTVGTVSVENGAIDITDNQKEYLVQIAYTAGTEVTAATSGASFVVYAAESYSSDVQAFRGAILDDSNSWRAADGDTSDRWIIRAGAVWSATGTPAVLDTFTIASISARVYSDGTVRLYDNSSGQDGIVYVLRRDP